MNTWKLNDILLNNQWITEEIKEEIKKYLQINDNKNTTIQSLQDESSSNREVYIDIDLPHETRKVLNNNPTYYPKELEKEG